MHFWASLFLAVAVSIDGMGAGLAYGAGNLKVPRLSLLIISVSSSLALLVAMYCGRSTATLFSPQYSSFIGGAILILVGIYIVGGTVQERDALSKGNRDITGARTTLLGLLRQPEKADFDSSGSIGCREAAVLGLALAMDAFGAGFGAAMTGYSPYLTCFLVGLCKFLFVSGGVYLGKKLADSIDSKKASRLAGGLLVFLGIINFV